MRTEEVNISPALAQSWMGGKNRTLRIGAVTKYKEDILNGNWKLTHQAIAIDWNGNVIDGQHRLAAIIKSGMSVVMLVAFDSDPETFDILDTGVSRNASDALFINGMAARTSKIVCSIIPLITNFEASGAISNGHQSKRYGSITPFVKDFINTNPDVIKSAEYGQLLPYRNNLLKQSSVCFLHYLISKKYDNASIFLDKVMVGDGVQMGSIEFELRRILIASKTSLRSITPEPLLIKKMINGFNYFNSEKKFTDYRQIVAATNLDSAAFIK